MMTFGQLLTAKIGSSQEVKPKNPSSVLELAV